MAKNPVRAARQAARQAVRSARTSSRMDTRALKTAAKVEKIGAKAAGKVAKIQAAAPKRAASEPMTKMESKGATKIATPASKGPVKTTPRSMSEVAKGMKPKKSGSKTPTPKQVAKKVMNASKKAADATKKVVSNSNSSSGSSSSSKRGLADGSMSKSVLDYSPRQIAEGAYNTGKAIKDDVYNAGKKVVDDVYNTAKRKAGYLGDAFDAGYNFFMKEKGGSVKKKYQAGGMTARPPKSVRKAGPSTPGSMFNVPGNKATAPARKVSTPGRINPMTGGMKKGGMVKRKK